MALSINLGITKLEVGQAQKEATLNEGLDTLDGVTAGRLSRSVAGSANVNLTRAEGLNAFYIFTGALTGNIEVRWPATGGTARKLSVHNNTTGAFTLTLTVAGGSGVAITQGERREFVIDGTAVVPMNTGTIGTYTAVAAQAIWARVFHSAAQSISNATLTALAFNSERVDTDVIHDNATNNSRLTCKTAGAYLIFGAMSWASNATGYRQGLIMLNATTFLGVDSKNAISGDTTKHVIATVYQLAVNDYVELFGYQTSGGALNVDNAGNFSAEFGMIRLGS